MTSAEEVGRILADAYPAARVLYLAALLSKEAGSGSGGLIVVGGSAVEIYTRGAYASADIDLSLIGNRYYRFSSSGGSLG